MGRREKGGKKAEGKRGSREPSPFLNTGSGPVLAPGPHSISVFLFHREQKGSLGLENEASALLSNGGLAELLLLILITGSQALSCVPSPK